MPTGAGAPFSIAQNYTLTVAAAAIVVSPATLPGAIAGTAYSQTLTATGSETPPAGFGYGVEYTQAQINDEILVLFEVRLATGPLQIDLAESQAAGGGLSRCRFGMYPRGKPGPGGRSGTRCVL